MNIEDWLGKDNILGQDIWKRKYQYENETFDEWIERITKGNQTYKDMILNKQFLPAGRILSNRGLNKKGVKSSLSNCYVLNIENDSLESIFNTAKEMARTYSYGGGVGIDISKLAPKGARVNNTAKHSSGAVSFMDLYSLVTGLIGQNGRRGALMISMDVTHPDIEEFIELKSDLDKVTKANISVKVTSKFMEAVINDENFKLSFTREESGETIEKVIKARELFDKLCYMNWDYAEPGILFWDRVKSWNLLSNNPDFEFAGVNPCAEEPLGKYGACLLGSINISAFVKNGEFNFEEFRRIVHIAVDYLNDILDEGIPLHPLKQQKEAAKNWRQIGLGYFGIADALIKLGIKYGSDEAVNFCDRLGKEMITEAVKESSTLASIDGPYPMYDAKVLDTQFFKENITDKEVIRRVKQTGLRNSQLLTCAPTGSIGTMIGISTGAEPIFANYYLRKTQSLHGHDEFYKVYTPIVEEYIKEHQLKDDTELPDYFVVASDISPFDRVRMQSVLQKHIDASISSTVNLPKEATVDDVKQIYLEAYKQGLKGITVYRSGCKREGILVTEPEKKEPANLETVEDVHKEGYVKPEWGQVLPVRSDLLGIKTKIVNGCGSFHLQLFYDEKTGRPWETFIALGDSGGCERNLETISKLISKSLRAGVDIEQIIETLKQTRPCNAYCRRADRKGDTSKGTSCPSAIGWALEDFVKKIKTIKVDEDLNIEQEIKDNTDKSLARENEMINNTSFETQTTTNRCPDCGAELVHEGGCDVCKTCGYSHCG